MNETLLDAALDFLSPAAGDAVAEALQMGVGPDDPWVAEIAKDRGLSPEELAALLSAERIEPPVFRIAIARLAGALISTLNCDPGRVSNPTRPGTAFNQAC